MEGGYGFMGRQIKQKLLMRLDAVSLAVIHHLKLLDARSQDRIVQSDVFRKAWNAANYKERKKILFWLKKIKPNKLKEWIRIKLFGELESMPIIHLRQLSSHYHIKNYSRKSRIQLIQEIKQRKDNGSKRRKK